MTKCVIRSHLALSRVCSERPANYFRWQLYHTASSPAAPPFNKTESTLLSAGLRQVPTYGFTRTALELGAQEVGYPPVSAAIFSHGPFDLVRFHLITQRLALSHSVQFPKLEEKNYISTRNRVRALLLARLRGNDALIHHWQDALALSGHPSRIQFMLSELFELSDEIWHLAGDRSVDFSWYTRRGSLAAIYASAELFQTSDASPGFRDTEAFVDRRLKEIGELGGMLAATGEWAAFSARSIANVARSKGFKI